MRIAFYGSSLLSSYWNGAATYYRGLLKALAALGHDITFYEPDVYDRRSHRDIAPPDWCRVIVYDATTDALREVTQRAAEADIVVKASGVGFAEDTMLDLLLDAAGPHALKIFWDVDAPATLAMLHQTPAHPLHAALRRLDAVLTYGGGAPVTSAYRTLGARFCAPVYNALDPQTHHPVPPEPRFACDLAFLGNRLPDREARVDAFFFSPAALLPSQRLILGGAGWEDKARPGNIAYVGHVGTADHNAFNGTAKAVLNISRDGMAATGFSPATRVFEAAGAGACLLTDAWEGIELFLQPGEEVLVARDGRDVVDIMAGLGADRAAAIGQAALRRVRRDHSYANRAQIADAIFRRLAASRLERAS